MRNYLHNFVKRVTDEPEIFILSQFLPKLLYIYSDTDMSFPYICLLQDESVNAERIPLFEYFQMRVNETSAEVTRIRDDLWAMLFTGDRPTKSQISRFVLRSLEIIESIFPMEMLTRVSRIELDGLVSEFLLPNAIAFFEANPKRHQATLMVLWENFCVPSLVVKYITEVASIPQWIQASLDKELRIRNPYNLGNRVVISFLDADAIESDPVFGLLLRSTSAQEDLHRLERKIIIKAAQGNRRLLLDSACVKVKVLFRRGTQLRRQRIIQLPYRDTGRFRYPSALQLKRDLENMLRPRAFKFYPILSLPDNTGSTPLRSPPLLTLPMELLTGIVKHALRDNPETDMGAICKLFRAIALPLYAAPSKRAKEMTLLYSIPQRLLVEFIISSVITISMRSEGQPEALRNALIALALFLSHSFPFRRESFTALLGELAKGQRIPPHLAQFIDRIDFAIFESLKLIFTASFNDETGSVGEEMSFFDVRSF